MVLSTSYTADLELVLYYKLITFHLLNELSENKNFQK